MKNITKHLSLKRAFFLESGEITLSKNLHSKQNKSYPYSISVHHDYMTIASRQKSNL